MATSDLVWRAQDTTPGAVEAAVRKLITEVHQLHESYVPARVLNLVCVVDKSYAGEVANRLRQVGRYHPSRTVVCAVSPRRSTIDAVAMVATPSEVRSGGPTIARETIVVDCGEQHLEHLDRIVDPLVVTDLATVVWSPHGHHVGVDALRGISQVVLVDSVDEPEHAEAVRRAQELAADRYVVDLAWLRSTPWRERLAATFDPAPVRGDLRLLSDVVVRHHPDSTVAAALLVGWLGSRLGWTMPSLTGDRRGEVLTGKVHTRKQDVAIRLEADLASTVRGLSSVEVASASGRWLRFDRGPGGLRAHYRNRRGTEREWTVMGASRGEAGILGAGIRAALLRDPTYAPALDAAAALLAR